MIKGFRAMDMWENTTTTTTENPKEIIINVKKKKYHILYVFFTLRQDIFLLFESALPFVVFCYLIKNVLAPYSLA